MSLKDAKLTYPPNAVAKHFEGRTRDLIEIKQCDYTYGSKEGEVLSVLSRIDRLYTNVEIPMLCLCTVTCRTLWDITIGNDMSDHVPVSCRILIKRAKKNISLSRKS